MKNLQKVVDFQILSYILQLCTLKKDLRRPSTNSKSNSNNSERAPFQRALSQQVSMTGANRRRGFTTCASMSTYKTIGTSSAISEFKEIPEGSVEMQKIKKVQSFFRGWLCRRRWKQIVEQYIKSPHAESMRKRNR